VSRDILRPANRRVLRRFAGTNVLVAFDFDGTLARIVPDPVRARMRPLTRELLAELANLYPCIVISGRAQADVRSRLGTVPVQRVVGNHGVEPWQASKRLSAQVKRWRVSLERRLGALPGVRVEDKTYSIAVHYRQSPEKAKARSAIARAVSALGETRVIGGKQVVNVVTRTAHDKGVALLKERERLGCETAIYAGDDDTDEDVFSLDDPARLLTIRVGARPTSAASYFIPGQADVDELLKVLVALRKNPESRRNPRPHRR
jgi:trehalose 6-phosphate phosphatase